MYKEALRAMADVGVFGSISLGLFFTLFAIVLVSVIAKKKTHIKYMSNMPLED